MNPIKTRPQRCLKLAAATCSFFAFSLALEAQIPKPCSVPSVSFPTVDAAIANTACATVRLAAGTYFGHFVIERNLNIIGDGAGVTFLDGMHNGVISGGTFNGAVLKLNAGSLYLEGVTVQNGSSQYNSGPSGVVMFSGGKLTVLKSVVSHDDGGGIACFGSCNIRIQDSDVSYNNDVSYNSTASPTIWGGIYFDSGALYIERTTVHDNPNIGIRILDSQASTQAYITDSTITNNAYGGISADTGQLYISSSTIANNADWGILRRKGELTMKSSIVANNGTRNCILEYSNGPVTHDAGYNLVWPNAEPACPGTVADPKLGPLAANGGPTLTMMPQSGSAAISRGSCTDVSKAGVPFDQRFRVRPTSGCDAGAVDTHATKDGHPDLVWWQLNEGSGYVAGDSSGRGLNGTVHSTSGRPAWVSGWAPMVEYNPASIYSGTSTSISSTPVTSLTDNVTVTLWVNCAGCSSYPNDMVPFFNGRFGYNGYGLIITPGNGHVWLFTGGFNFFDFGWAMPTTNTWLHLALVRTAGVWRLYVNGAPVGHSSTLVAVAPDTGTFVGADSTNSRTFGGYVDDFRVYSRPLSQGEIGMLAAGLI